MMFGQPNQKVFLKADKQRLRTTVTALTILVFSYIYIVVTHVTQDHQRTTVLHQQISILFCTFDILV
jgi:hypothetical protein